MRIKDVRALPILNSRGEWVVETEIEIEEGGLRGKASVPSGASLSHYEVKNLPAEASVKILETTIKEKLFGQNFPGPIEFDRFLASLDSTSDRSQVGGNTLLSLSMAFCRAGALSEKLPLFKYLERLFDEGNPSPSMPFPIFNVVNGGAHASGKVDFQEFLVIPRLESVERNIRAGEDIYQALKGIFERNGFSTSVGDEGGFVPEGLSTFGILNFVAEAVKLAGYALGQDVFLGIDAAASQLSLGDLYLLKNDGLSLSAAELRQYYLRLRSEFPIIYFEDPLDEKSLPEWRILKKMIGEEADLVGDDLVATNVERIRAANLEGALSSVIIKPNQVGTITEALAAIRFCRESGLGVVVSHRSGETGETFIADLAYAAAAQYFKAGAPARGERVAKYDRLLEISRGIEA